MSLPRWTDLVVDRFDVRNPFDPEQNARGALAHLRWLLERFGEDGAQVSAAYSASEGMVERYGGMPPFPETRAYVQRIVHFYRAARHACPDDQAGRRPDAPGHSVSVPLIPRGPAE